MWLANTVHIYCKLHIKGSGAASRDDVRGHSTLLVVTHAGITVVLHFKFSE